MLMNQAADEKQMLMNQAVQDADEIEILMDQATQAADEILRFSDIFSDLCTHIPKDANIKTRRRKKQGRGESPMEGAKKRKLSTEQMNFLEMSFEIEHKLQSSRKIHLARELGLDPEQVAVWFQNRRARWKSKQIEEEYAKMKAAHETVIIQKCQLEAEVLKLREQLLEAEKEVRMLSKHPVAGVSAGSSPSSSLSIDPAFLGEFEENFLYAPESMDWENLYYL